MADPQHIAQILESILTRKELHQMRITSPEWRLLKHRIIQERGAACERCRQENKFLHLHHLNYRNLGAELDEDLMLLCTLCHAREHGASLGIGSIEGAGRSTFG